MRIDEQVDFENDEFETNSQSAFGAEFKSSIRDIGISLSVEPADFAFGFLLAILLARRMSLANSFWLFWLLRIWSWDVVIQIMAPYISHVIEKYFFRILTDASKRRGQHVLVEAGKVQDIIVHEEFCFGSNLWNPPISLESSTSEPPKRSRAKITLARE